MRLIDADALLERMCGQCNVEIEELPCEPDDCFVRTIIKYDAPTIDAVPVVRCADCVHFGAEAVAFDAWTPYCLKHRMAVFHDDFCSYGERRGGEG